MKFNKHIVILIGVVSFCCSGCYTTLNLPLLTADEPQDEETLPQTPLNPSIPTARTGDFDWIYYYQLPWWYDASEAMFDQAPGQSNAPEEFRQRYPQDRDYSGSYSGSYAPTVTAPVLGKQPADSSHSAPAEQPRDPRRSFHQGGASPSPGLSTPARNRETDAERNDTTTPTDSTSGQKRPKRR